MGKCEGCRECLVDVTPGDVTMCLVCKQWYHEHKPITKHQAADLARNTPRKPCGAISS